MTEAAEMTDASLESPEIPGDGAGAPAIAPESADARYAAATRASNSLESSLLAGAAIATSLAVAAHVHGDPASQLPGFWGAAIFLVVVAQQDARRRKIPNWLTGPALLIGLGFNIWTTGTSGLVSGLLGAGLPFVMLFALYAFRAIGAGDVKALMALGALWGPTQIIHLMIWASLAGGLMAVVLLAVHGELLPLLRRWGLIAYRSVRLARFQYLPPEPGRAAAGGLPFGISIGLGVTAQLLFKGGPWL